nr:NADH-ubiquinone oxidoreductase chain 6 [Discogaster dentipes]
MLLYMLIAMSFVFIWLKHPISVGVLIILQTLITAMITGLMMGSFWFSYILTITMLSGILVLFIYMASVASNEKFHSSIKLFMMSIIIIMIGVYSTLNSEYSEENSLMIATDPSNEIITLTTLFNTKFKYITIFLVMYLFLTMVTVSLIVNISEGPLRINKK